VRKKDMASGSRQRFPRWWQGLIILVGGLVIGLSSCAGFLSQVDFGGVRHTSEFFQLLFAAGFLGGLAAAFIGFVLLLIAIARGVVNAMRPPDATPALTPEGARVFGAAAPAYSESAEYRTLRQLQIALVVLMLLPAASIATGVLVMMTRPNLWPSVILIVISYALSQAPYGIALLRTRRGPDRIGIAVAFTASCVMIGEGLLPFVHLSSLVANRVGPYGWPSLFLLGHVVVAVYAWRAGRLAPAEGDDLAVLAASFGGVAVYLILLRFLDARLLPFYLLGGRFR
jgi:hypothetical protein